MRKILSVFMAAGLVTGIAACSPSESKTQSSNQPQVVKIGFAAPLTGQSARIGKDLQNGAQLAVDEINATAPVIGGRQVRFELLAEDDQSDPRTAVIAAQRLVDAKVAGVVGHWNTGASIPASRIYQAAGIPQIAPASTGHQYTQQGFATSFRAMGHDDVGGAYTGQYAVKTLKAQRIAVIDDRTAFGSGLADQFIAGVKANGGVIVSRDYVTDKTMDFSAVLTSIKGRQADLVFFGGIDAQAGPLRKQMHKLGLNTPLLGAGGFVSQTFLKLAGKDGEGVTALEPGLPLEQMPRGQAFEQAYRTKYNAPIELHAPFAYDAVQTLVDAMKKAGSTDPAKYLAVLKTNHYAGVTGQMAFDKEGNLSNPSFTIYQVRGGKWVAVDTLGGAAAAKPAA